MTQKGYIKRTQSLSINRKGDKLFYKAYLELKWKDLEKVGNVEETD